MCATCRLGEALPIGVRGAKGHLGDGKGFMPSTMRVERARRRFTDESNRYDIKRNRLVRHARELGERGNAAKISVTDITQSVGITRGLFYYYFGGKEDLNIAIADTYISDLEEAIDASIDANTDDRVEVVEAIVSNVCAWNYEEDGTPRPMQHVLREIGMHDYVCRETASMLAELLIQDGFVTDYGKMGADRLMHRVRFVMMGLVGEAHLHPDVTVEELVETTCAALRFRHRRK